MRVQGTGCDVGGGAKAGLSRDARTQGRVLWLSGCATDAADASGRNQLQRAANSLPASTPL